MKVYRSLEEVPAFINPAITLGTFDGVHLGHRIIIDQLKKAAEANKGESVALTFWPHPRMVLYPDDESLKLLNTIDEKIDLLAQTGLDHLIIMPFTLALSRMAYFEFVRDILVGMLHVSQLVVGHDHHFGKNREGNYELLQECASLYNFGLEQVQVLELDDVAISSSKIRAALQAGDIEKANKFLGYTYAVEGSVVHGEKRGRELGYPTANILVEEKYKLIPADGIYAVEAVVDGKTHRGMASIGYNPTFNGQKKTVEVNIFDFDADIYNQKLILKFWHFLRKEVRFVNSTELVTQIDSDKEGVLQFFSNQ